MDWKDKLAVIVGMGRQGSATARYLAAQGARLRLTDSRSTDALQTVIEAMADVEADWVLGEHPFSLLQGAEAVFPSGGVPLTIPLITEANKRGIPLSNDSQLFLEAAPCKVIGITGSAGKTTTTTLVGRMAQVATEMDTDYHKAYVGGNIGNPLIADVNLMQPNDLAVMELSSFQLQIMTQSPPIAALLNITPNHLDRHADMQEYVDAKLQILVNQQPNDFAVLNREDRLSWQARSKVKGDLLSFGLHKPDEPFSGTFLQDSMVTLRQHGEDHTVLPLSDIQLRGQHNLLNVLAACTIAAAADIPPAAMKKGVAGFAGVEHRLEFVRSWGGAKWYNDSIATAPERTIAAIHAFDEPLVMLIGGRDKHLPWDEFAQLAAERVDHIVLFGEAAELVKSALDKTPGKYTLDTCYSLTEAVQTAAERINEGDVVLLSPGGTSYDQYTDFAERGREYKRLVKAL